MQSLLIRGFSGGCVGVGGGADCGGVCGCISGGGGCIGDRCDGVGDACGWGIFVLVVIAIFIIIFIADLIISITVVVTIGA